MGSVTITKDENDKYNFEVTTGGAILNAIANIFIDIVNIFLPEESEHDKYGMYKYDDSSKTATQWEQPAKDEFARNAASKAQGCNY
jgi:hypothetical protein